MGLLESQSALNFQLAFPKNAPICREIIQKAYYSGKKLMTRDPKVLLKSEDYFVHLSKEKRLFLILYNQSIIGTFTLTVHRTKAELQYLAILPEYQNQSLGSKAVSWVESFLLNKKITLIRLETYNKWEKTNKFYRHHGFHVVDSFEKENEKILVWEKKLNLDLH